MALTKRTYVDGQTVITASNLNDIQDAIIKLETDDVTMEQVNEAISSAINDSIGGSY